MTPCLRHRAHPLSRLRRPAHAAAALGATLLAAAPAGAQNPLPYDDLAVEQLADDAPAPNDPNGPNNNPYPNVTPYEPLAYRSSVDTYAFAPTTPAWFGPWDPAGWLPSYGCQVPSVWECLDPAFPQTECAQVDAWVQRDYPGGSPCEWVVGQALQGWLGQLPRVIQTRLDGSLFETVDMAMFQRRDTYVYEGSATSYADELALLHLEEKSTTGPIAALDFRPKAVRRAEWEGNGAAVASCKEYVWEKWYDWSKFEDVTAGVDGEYGRFVYDRAVHPVTGLVDKVIRSRGGAPQKRVSFPAEPLPKNAYFLFQRTPFDKVPMDPSILPDPSGRAFYAASWGWHQGMSAALAGVPDASLEHEYDRQVSFKRLLARRAKLLAELTAASGGMYTEVFPDLPGLPFIAALKLSGSEAALAPYAGSATAKVDEAVAALPPSLVDATVAGMTSPSAIVTVTDPLYGVSLPVYTGGYTGKMGQLYLVDLEIKAYLEHARDVGCLAPGGVSVCDWSPRLMAEHLRGQFASEREADMRDCLERTGDDFAPGAMIHEAYAGYGMPFATPGKDYASDSESVRAFFAIYDAYVRDYLEFTPEPGSVTEAAKGWWAYDKKKLGSDKWNMGYEYKLGWGLLKNSGAKTGMCDTDLRVQGMAKGTATLAGKEIKVIDADNYMGSEDGVFVAHGHLKVLGKVIYDTPKVSSEIDFQPVAFKLTAAPSVKAVITIVFVPVTVEVGLSGEAGMAVRLTAKVQRVCPEAGAATFEISGGAGLTPFIHVAGFGAVGIGAPGLQAKLQVELDLLNLDAPLTLTARLAPTTSSIDSLRLEATTTFDLTLKSLSGRVRGILESPFGDTSETLLSWPGLPETRLVGWKKSWRIPVAAVLGKI